MTRRSEISRNCILPPPLPRSSRKSRPPRTTEASAREWLAYLISPDVAEAEENLAIAQQELTNAQAAVKASPSEAANQAVQAKQQAVDYLNEKLTQAWTYYNNVYLPENFGVYENAGTRRYPKQVLATTTDPITGEEIPDINAPSTDDLTTAQIILRKPRKPFQREKPISIF